MSRSPGGRGAGLSADQIVAAALELMDREGVDALTMRRLAERLGVQAQALYWHFPNKDALCRGVVDKVASQLRLTPTRGRSPRRQLEHHLRSLRAHWQEHPSVIALGRRHPPTAAGSVAERGIQLVQEFGVHPADAAEYYGGLVWLVLGFLFVEQTLPQSIHHHERSPGKYTVAIEASDGTYGAMEVDTDRRFENVLTMALDGLQARIDRKTDALPYVSSEVAGTTATP